LFSQTTYHRFQFLDKAYDLMMEDMEQLVAVMTEEQGMFLAM
jgi:acyl-CoA reductase-like NAD-dependent aldehyde dehydrogenase